MSLSTGNEHLQDRVVFWRDPELGGLEMRFSSFDSRTFPRHTHESYAIGLVEGGRSTFYYRGRHLNAEAGQIALIGPGEVHSCNPKRHSGWRYRMYYVPAAWMAELAGQLSDRPAGFPGFAQALVDDRLLYHQLHCLFDLLAESNDIAHKQTAMLEGFAELLHRQASLRPAPSGREHRAVAMVEAYLRQHLTDTITLSTLATLTDLSPYYLLRIFKAEKGLPPHAFHTQLRIERAKELLGKGGDIATVALATGFNDQSHFSKKFKSTTGATPRQYKLAC